MTSNIKEKLLGASGSISGGLSVLGSYQVCHNVCMGLLSLLTLLGFTVAGMPLLFLTRIAIPFWTVAVMLLITMILLKYAKKMNISGKPLLLNSGLIIAGIPFQQLRQFNYIFWITGGILVLSSVGWYFFDRFKAK